MLIDRKTKIVATMGPSTTDREMLKSCVQAGLNVARLNFSHGSHEDHAKMIQAIKGIVQELQAPIAVLQDLQGPKIRVGTIEDRTVSVGDMIFLSDSEDKDTVPIDLPNLHKYVSIGDPVLINDGLLELVVTRVVGKKVECRALYDGVIEKRKGVNLPKTSLPMSSLTEKDKKDLAFGIQQNVDHVALSFVRTKKDIEELRQLLPSGSNIRVVAKIEMAEAIENLEEIMDVSDAVMVARGDLAVEVGAARLAGLQKKIIALANKKGKPVITATQMLESMRENPRPTRAEITDVANAVLDGSDAVMLSAETASGQYPRQAIETMHNLIVEAEKSDEIYHKIDVTSKMSQVPNAISVSASLCAAKLDAAAIVCLSTTGKTARLISRFRPKAKLIAATDKHDTLSSLELCWGVQTLPVERYESWEDIFESLEPLLIDHGIVQPGDSVVLTLGLPIKAGIKTNSMRVFIVSDISSKKTRRPLRFQP